MIYVVKNIHNELQTAKHELLIFDDFYLSLENNFDQQGNLSLAVNDADQFFIHGIHANFLTQTKCHRI